MTIAPTLPAELAGRAWLCFRRDADPTAAAARFAERFGFEPDYAVVSLGNLLVGPIPHFQSAIRNQGQYPGTSAIGAP